MKRPGIIKIILLFSFYSYCSFAQTGQVSVKANIDSCLVFIDSVYVGKTPVINYQVKPGVYSLKAVTKEPDAWDKQTIEQKVKIDSAKEYTAELEFKMETRILSEPDNAEVYLNSKKAGNTPADILFNIGDTLTLSKENYEKISVILDKKIRKPALFSLVQISKPEPVTRLHEFNGNKKTYYALIGGGLAFGVFSVFAKHRADNLETDYRNGPTDDLKSQIRKYDLISGISLGFFEACFLALSYLLLSD
jgi:hypothetical protein